jgi:carbon storage regulator CsrA
MMLVLTRKVGDRIKIGDNITVVIIKIRGNQITVGIEAPRDVRIIRGELDPFDDYEEQDPVVV